MKLIKMGAKDAAVNFAQRAILHVESLAEQGGPLPEQDDTLNATLRGLRQLCQKGLVSGEVEKRVHSLIVGSFAPDSIVERVRSKPLGYAGDYQVIDTVLQRATSHVESMPTLHNWDRFFFNLSPVHAVQERMRLFHQAIDSCRRCGGASVLSLASGPCRDIAEYIAEHRDANLHFDCIDNDPRAVTHAQALLSSTAHADAPQGTGCSTDVLQANPFRHRPAKKYDLIWSSGLFDYASDGLFVATLKRLVKGLAPGGQLVIGNFGPETKETHFREDALDWHLKLRSTEQLLDLGKRAAPEAHVSVETDELGEIHYLKMR